MNNPHVDKITSMDLRTQYEKSIKTHPNYAFLPEELKTNWVSVSKKGKNPRKPYWDAKQKELVESNQLPNKSIPVNVARFIHPTKMHVCKMCKLSHSIYYEYPNENTWKWLKKTFNFEQTDETKHLTIFEIYRMLDTPAAFENYFGMPMDTLEKVCKSDGYSGKKLSPGVMSNAPDRLDGFHCYNSICGCRPAHDKGRSEENMKSYTRDRRAYEHLSDGNCLLANCLMGKLNTLRSTCFMCGKSAQMMTADHIGPISLGFIHDTVNFQACCVSCNTAKNNRLTQEDVQKLKMLEEQGNTIVSWWAEDAWKEVRDMDHETIKKHLDQNTKKFITVLEHLKATNPNVLEEFVTQIYMNHTKAYNINSVNVLPNGFIEFEYSEVVSKKKTKDTQYTRTVEILLQSTQKVNRKTKTHIETTDLLDITVDTFKSKTRTILARK